MTEPLGIACGHTPPCPASTAAGHAAARVVARHPGQGWSLLCNGVVVFDDGGELHPDRSTVPAHTNRKLAATTH